MTRLLAISPHLDDSVFACGELIAPPGEIEALCAQVDAFRKSTGSAR